LASHVHSDWSYDGSWTLSDLARAFAQRGYDAVLMAEHDRGFDAERWNEYREACAAASTSELLLVPGMEYASPDEHVHVPVWGSGAFLGPAVPTTTLLALAAEQGRLAVIAHPRRRDVWQGLDPEWLQLAHGIEIWNRKYDGWAPFAPACGIAEHSGLACYVGLDFHTARQFAPLAMHVEVDDDIVDERALLAALAAHNARPLVAGRIEASRFAHGPAHAGVRLAEFARRRGGAVVRRAGLRH
jgi:hypothetical protein